MNRRQSIVLGLAFALTLPLAAATRVASVFVDATDARRAVFHAHVTLPAAPGPMTFVYPKWVPGEHTPSGPLMQMVGLHVRAGGSELAWSRDNIDMFAFHIDVPKGADSVDVDFDYLSPSTTFGVSGYGESANATKNLLAVLWNQLIVYEPGTPTDQITVRASVRLPEGWKFDTALPVDKTNGDRTDFQPVSLTTLVDSPLLAGAFVRTIPIAEDGRVHLFIAADSPQALALPDERIAQIRNLVPETDALFGARHYRTYRWLMALSDSVETQGLEHHESSDNRAPERAFIDPNLAARHITVLSHEFVHSWNGKYRRPAGLATPDYQAPMIGELLWVYEGMTRYLGNFVLPARSGLYTADAERDYIAYVAGNQIRNRPGRNWRPLVDTAVAVQSIAESPIDGVPYRRSLDYYDESGLIWLEADTIIRSLSGGTKSFDDFCKRFFGPPSSAPMVRAYTIDDIVAALNETVPYDWRAFFETRIYRIAPQPPLGGIEAAGWNVVWNETPNSYLVLREKAAKSLELCFSLGLFVKADGTITDLVFASPAYAAGMAPGMKITAVNGRKWSDEVIREELRASRGTTQPIEIIAEFGASAATYRIDYHEGERYPHLERNKKPDLLSDILRPHAHKIP
ncbi:MAG TPA: M61 family peptidase [Thermoanaerobaculia bacterium]|nr:M61 family peptidase [Thermoanaerobaculia bacterium]